MSEIIFQIRSPEKRKIRLHINYENEGSIPINSYECGYVFLVVSTPKKEKIIQKILDCIFIGHAHNNSTYQFMSLKFHTYTRIR